MSGRTPLRRAKDVLSAMPGMITCQAFEDFIDDYLEGALGHRQRFVFELHVLLCPNCRRYLAAFRRSRELGQAAWSEEESGAVPEDLIAAILTAKREEG